MAKTASKIRFKAKLLQPAEADSWTFLTLPKEVSAKLPSRSMTAVEGTINGFAFRATLQPDGEGSHWLKVEREMSEAAGAKAGDIVVLEIAPAAEEVQLRSVVQRRRHHDHQRKEHRTPSSLSG
ncbi:MAG: DUF1905 domain-containing protein [Chthoniobacterales bacterium]|nr:DUF1905 domain-containing protein [Chthoniobacterales bacterium]